MRVEIWSDVVCPWCYIGKRRFEKALGRFEDRDSVEVVWRSFQLEPSYPKGARTPLLQHLAAKYGRTIEQARAMNDHVTALARAEGLAYDLDGYTVVNTLDAHRLTHLAKAHGLSMQMHERLLRAQLVEGQVLDDPATLVRLSAEAGVRAEDAQRVLASDEHASDVQDDISEAHALGVNGVPFFVIDRKYGISGAQQVELFLQALQSARDESAHGSESAT